MSAHIVPDALLAKVRVALGKECELSILGKLHTSAHAAGAQMVNQLWTVCSRPPADTTRVAKFINDLDDSIERLKQLINWENLTLLRSVEAVSEDTDPIREFEASIATDGDTRTGSADARPTPKHATPKNSDLADLIAALRTARLNGKELKQSVLDWADDNDVQHAVALRLYKQARKPKWAPQWR